MIVQLNKIFIKNKNSFINSIVLCVKKKKKLGLYKFAKAIEKNGLPKNDKSWRQLVNKQLTLYDNMKKLTDIVKEHEFFKKKK